MAVASRLLPLWTGLWAGLTGGVVYGLVDNLPCLVQGDILSHVRIRLQAIAYTTVLYTLTFALILGAIGLLVTVLLALIRRLASRPHLLGGYIGLLTAAIACASWLYRFGVLNIPEGNRNRPVAIAVCGLAGAVVGAGAGWIVYRIARWWEEGPEQRRPLLRRVVHWGTPVLVLIATIFLIGLGLYRNVLRYAFPSSPADGPASAERPNIILITIDALRADHLGVYGYDPAISPNIDALAQRGAVFNQAIAQSSWTLPSVASMITSMYPTELDVYSWHGLRAQTHVDPMRTTLAESLEQDGYRTQAYVTNAWLTTQNGFDQGFDGYVGIRPQEPFDLELLQKRPLLGLAWRSPFLRRLLQQSFGFLFDHRLSPGNDRRYVSAYGLDFLRQHRNERFFLWLYYMEPHSTYNPSQPFPSMPAGFSQDQLNRLQSLDFWSLVDTGPAILSQEEIPALVSLYDGEIHDVDIWIGEITAELDRLGLSDRTLIALHSDHGEEFADHGGFGHGSTLYDELLRVPLIIAGPGVVQNGVIETPVQLLDLMPTLLDAAGVPPSPEARGRSLAPILRGEDMELEERPIYGEMLHTTIYEQKTVRYQGWKLIHHFSDGRQELYDLQADPWEQVNLAEKEPQRAEEYLRLLRHWLAEAVKAAGALPRSAPPPDIDGRVQEMLREGGY